MANNTFQTTNDYDDFLVSRGTDANFRWHDEARMDPSELVLRHETSNWTDDIADIPRTGPVHPARRDSSTSQLSLEDAHNIDPHMQPEYGDDGELYYNDNGQVFPEGFSDGSSRLREEFEGEPPLPADEERYFISNDGAARSYIGNEYFREDEMQVSLMHLADHAANQTEARGQQVLESARLMAEHMNLSREQVRTLINRARRVRDGESLGGSGTFVDDEDDEEDEEDEESAQDFRIRVLHLTINSDERLRQTQQTCAVTAFLRLQQSMRSW